MVTVFQGGCGWAKRLQSKEVCLAQIFTNIAYNSGFHPIEWKIIKKLLIRASHDTKNSIMCLSLVTAIGLYWYHGWSQYLSLYSPCPCQEEPSSLLLSGFLRVSWKGPVCEHESFSPWKPEDQPIWLPASFRNLFWNEIIQFQLPSIRPVWQL